jgi:hypothetical protein
LVAAVIAKGVDDLGLAIAAAGAVLLFAYGIPFGQRTRGVGFIMLERVDEAEKARDARADLLSWLGLTVGLVGVVLQGLSVWL